MCGVICKKTVNRTQDVYKPRVYDFQLNLDNLVDNAHADDLENMEIEEDKLFSQREGELGHLSCLAGVDNK